MKYGKYGNKSYKKRQLTFENQSKGSSKYFPKYLIQNYLEIRL